MSGVGEGAFRVSGEMEAEGDSEEGSSWSCLRQIDVRLAGSPCRDTSP